MNTQKVKPIPAQENPLKAIKGYKDQSQKVNEIIDAAWNVAQTALWNTSTFSNKEVQEAKEWIGFYFLNSKDLYKAYSVFCQRVLLARQYISRSSNRYVPLPSIWLNPENETGFIGTRNWYEQVMTVRESLPNHKQELKAFGEAIWELSQEPTGVNFHYWRNYFVEAGTNGLLNLFLSTVANQQFHN